MNAAISVSETGVPERIVPGTPHWQMYFYEHIQRYEYFAHHAFGLDVLDAACGVGYGSELLGRSGARAVLGVDIAEGAIEFARARYANQNVRFAVGDVQNVPLEDSSIDMVVSFETIEHVPDPEAFVREVARVLRPGGRFVCSTPNAAFHRTGTNVFHLSEMTFDRFTALFEMHFDVESSYHQSHSPGYLRHLDLVSELERLHKAARFSLAFRIEEMMRGWLHKEHVDLSPVSPALSRTVPGDFVIEPVSVPLDTHLTLILLGRVRK